MYRACIALVDATRARLFTFDRDSDAGETREELLEHEDLVDPARHQRLEPAFARRVVRELGALLERSGAHRLIVCARPSMLGELRAADLRGNGIVIDEVRHDLVELSSAKLRERLAEYGLLPPVPPRAAREVTP